MKGLLNYKSWSKDRFFFIAFMCLGLSSPLFMSGQASSIDINNAPQGPNEYLGWDASVMTELRIRHNTPGQPIIFATDGQERMRIISNGNVLIGTTLDQGGQLNILQDGKPRAITGTTTNVTLPAGNTADLFGMRSLISGGTNQANMAIRARCIGLSKQDAAAVAGIAQNGGINIGIWGRAQGQGQLGTGGLGSWAGFFDGNVSIVNGSWSSDSLLKTNVENLIGIRSLLLLLNPVKYEFAYEGLNLPEGIQYGFIAQEVEEVFPSLVRDVTVPVYSSQGLDNEWLSLKTLNSIELIPLLVAGFNEQTSDIDETQNRINSLLNDLQVLDNSDSGE